MAKSGTASPPANLELNCLVFGDPERLFTVSVANTDRVSKLQELEDIGVTVAAFNESSKSLDETVYEHIV
jgi:hypothetical protein